MVFDAIEDLRIDAFVGAHRVDEIRGDLPPLRLRTAGLRERGHAEFEIHGVPVALVGEGHLLLQRAGDSVVQRAPLHAGQPWASRLDSGFLVATVMEGSASVLRILDPDANDFDDAPKMALTAVAVDRARRVHSEAPELAERIVQTAIEWCPGEVGPGYELAGGHLCNQGNSLAYLTASEWSETDGDTLYRMALERSQALVHAELGGPAPTHVPWTLLLLEVAALVKALQDSVVRAPVRDLRPAPLGMCMLPSPVLRLAGNELTQALAIGLPQYRAYFYEGAVAAWLRHASVQALVAEIYDRASATPISVLTASRRTVHDVYEGGYRFDATTPSRGFALASTLEDPSPIPLLTRILAAVGREIAAGLSIPECRARWGLERVPETLEAAASKLHALHVHEDQSIRTAYGFA